MESGLPKVVWRHLRGDTLDQLLGADWADGVAAADRARVETAWQSAKAHHAALEIEYSAHRTDAPPAWYLLCAAPIHPATAAAGSF